jgi:putative membrane protein
MRRRHLIAAIPLTALAGRAGAQSLLEQIPSAGMSAETFVEEAARSDAYEIESSRILLARSTHPQIREFAQRMIEHHTMTTNELRGMPDAARFIPASLDLNRAAMIQVLQNQVDLDLLNRHYVDQQIEAHEQALVAFDAYARGGQVVPLRDFATRGAALIRQHLEMARALQLRPRE